MGAFDQVVGGEKDGTEIIINAEDLDEGFRDGGSGGWKGGSVCLVATLVKQVTDPGRGFKRHDKETPDVRVLHLSTRRGYNGVVVKPGERTENLRMKEKEICADDVSRVDEEELADVA